MGLAWTGPYLVIESHLGWVVTIQDKPQGKTKTVHIDNLKPCPYTPALEPWIHARKGGEDQPPTHTDQGIQTKTEEEEPTTQEIQCMQDTQPVSTRLLWAVTSAMKAFMTQF